MILLSPRPKVRAAAGPTPFTLNDAMMLVGVPMGGLAVFKVAQAAFGDEYPRRCYPRWFRQHVIDEHVASYRPICFGGGRRVRRRNFDVDHIVPYGRTSRLNARVMCRRCTRSAARLG